MGGHHEKKVAEPAVDHPKGDNYNAGFLFIVFMSVLFIGFLVVISCPELFKIGSHIHLLNK